MKLPPVVIVIVIINPASKIRKLKRTSEDAFLIVSIYTILCLLKETVLFTLPKNISLETVFPYLRQHPWNFHITDVHSMYIPGDISVSYLFLQINILIFDHIHSGRITFHYFCIFSTAFITGCILKKSDSCIFIF